MLNGLTQLGSFLNPGAMTCAETTLNKKGMAFVENSMNPAHCMSFTKSARC
jgi:hypothetical protein